MSKVRERDLPENPGKSPATHLTRTLQSEKAKYDAEELVSSAKLFGVYPELVDAALKSFGVQRASEAEARQIIESFKNKEVK